MLSIVKPGGLMFISVPTANGTDALAWNAHRIYGRYRLEKLFAGWKLIDVIGKGSPSPTSFVQHLWVLQNVNGCKGHIPTTVTVQ